MKIKRISVGILIILVTGAFYSFLFAQDDSVKKVIKVACIGNSITEGVGIKDTYKDSYPAVLRRMPGDGYLDQPYPGKKSKWLGCDVYTFNFKGREAKISMPKKTAPGKPWIWRAMFFDHFPKADSVLLEKGFHLAYIEVTHLYGGPKAVRYWDDFYKYITEVHGFNKKTNLEGFSRAGLIVFSWAAKNPEKIATIYVDAPVCDIKSWPGKKSALWKDCLKELNLTDETAMDYKGNPIGILEPIAKAGIPILSICGDSDLTVPYLDNTAIVEKKYKELGGKIKVILKPGIGHHPHGLDDPTPIVDFILQNQDNYFAQESELENRIIKADSLWKTNYLSQVINQYKQIINNEKIPDEYQSFVYLRLAKSQYQAGLFDDCRKTLSEIKVLPILPEHHALKIAELEKKLNGLPITEHTVIPAGSKTAASLFVSTSISSDSKKMSYKSIEEALIAAQRILNKPNLQEGAIEIILDQNTYYINSTIKIDRQFTGTKQNPIIIRSSSPAKKVLITGGMMLKKWQKETNPEILARLPEISRNKVKVIVADLKANGINDIGNLIFGGFSSARVAGGDARFNSFPVPEFFYDGKPQIMARWPNDKDTIIALGKFKDSRMFRWTSETDMWLHGYWFYLWADAYEKVKSISVKDTTINLEPPVNKFGFGESKWHVVNALSEIDTPGEYCLSVKDGKIWYFPYDNFDPEKCCTSMSGPVFKVENCNYFSIKDIDFRYIRGDGMVFTGCNDLTLSNCDIKDVSGIGIRIIGGKHHLIHSCNIESIGKGGIDIISGNLSTLQQSGSIIENCKIGDLSRIDRTYTPALLLEGVGIKVRHCLFSNIPSSAIRLEGNDMLIEMNEFTKCVIESDDQGSIDIWGNPLYRGNLIRWNFFHDIGIPKLHMAAGIRLDDAISGFCIYENLFLRSSNNRFGGIQINGGKDNFIEGNIFANCHAAISHEPWGKERWKKSLENKDWPMYTAIQKYDWQSDLWQKRYPALKNLVEGNLDRNYTMDNIAINAQSLYLGKTGKLQSLNNTMMSSEIIPISPLDYKIFLLPWHPIPLDRIGIYK